MSLPVWQATIVNEFGEIIPSPTMTIIDEATGLGLTVYSDVNGATPLGTDGVFTGGTDGFAQFFAPTGRYSIKAENLGAGFERTFRFVALTAVGTAAGQVPLNSDLSTPIAGTSSFLSDTYTFSPLGTGFPSLSAGAYLSFRLPVGSANTTTTPDINYNGTTYTIKWIDGSALEASDLSEAYNKHPILFYYDGTDMLISSDVGGSNANGDWCRKMSGAQESEYAITTATGGDVIWTFPKAFLAPPSVTGICISPDRVVTIGATSPTTGATSFRGWIINTGARTTSDATVVAKGRWY